MSLKMSLENQLAEATKIESALKTVKSEAESSKLRFKLCEIFHDIILEDCTTALRKDIPGRLWYSCFYKRIGEMRSRIVKDKARLKKRKANGEDSEEHHKRLANSEEGLKTFLGESLTFYKYFLDELQGMIMPPSSQTQISQFLPSQSQARSQSSQFSQSSTVSVSKSAQKNVVPTIHKLYIHKGDLHRYEGNFSLAEKAYLNASSLAPGKGNPYNQLGVVAQLKEAAPGGHPLPAVAFYWYCRSLAATDGAFETSDGNVKRLFVANEKWLDSHGGNFQGSLRGSLEGSDKDQAKQIKSVASRIVLSRFVKFHGLLYQNKILDSIREELIYQIGEILDVNPFGDSLLIKMVGMNAFSVWRGLQKKDEKDRQVGVAAYAFMLQFGRQLCLRLQGILEKTKVKLESGGKCANIRLLGPLLLLCEYISEASQGSTLRRADIEPFLENIQTFWSAIANIANTINESSHLSNLADDADHDDNVSDEVTLPDDFKVLSKGFKPYLFLDENYTQSEKGTTYLSPEDATNALGLNASTNQSQMSQRSRKSLSSEKSHVRPDYEAKLKVARFNAFVSKHIEAGDLEENDGCIQAAHECSRSEPESTNFGGTLITSDVENLSQGRFSIEDDDSSTSVCDDDNDGRDVLVYKDSGQGKPALLVPNALLLGETTEKKDDGTELLKLSAMIDVDSTQNKTPDANDLTGDLLNSSAAFHQATGAIKPPLEGVEETKVQLTEKQDGHILTPMATVEPDLKDKGPVRPPPGFQPPAPALQTSLYSAPQTSSTPEVAYFGSNLNNYSLSSHVQHDGRTIINSQQPNHFPSYSNLPPGFHQPHAYNTNPPPQTRNPFASSSYGLEAHHTSRLSGSYGINSSTYELPSFRHNHSTKQSTSTGFEQNGTLDLDSDHHDRFGLRSLGIFSDESTSKHLESNNPLPQTSNPFVFK